MSIELIDIIGVKQEWQSEHRIKALEVNGTAEVLAFLGKCEKDSRPDYIRLMTSLKIIGQNTKLDLSIRFINRLKKSKRYDNVYEVLGHNARLFFFFHECTGTKTAVFTNGYWKTNASRRRQNRSGFDRCERFKNLYEQAQRK